MKIARISSYPMPRMNWKTYLALSLLFILAACSQKSSETQLGFYHWQTKVDLTATEQSYLRQADKLYVKFFDVDWNGSLQMAAPQAQVQWSSELPDSLEMVPTIFITNRTLSKTNDNALPDLAEKIAMKVHRLSAETSFEEVQFDCDWTASTKGKYFELLRLLRQHFDKGVQFSATIRLHQIQYADRTGMPPVERGMLMFYNMGDLENWETDNSILDVDIGRSYLGEVEGYSLPLDVALPIFYWGVVFRDNRLLQLKNNLQPSDLADTSRFVRLSPQRFQAKKSTYLDGTYLYAGDRLRLETIQFEGLRAAAQLLAERLRPENRTVVFYHLDTATIKNFPYVTLDSIYTIFQ